VVLAALLGIFSWLSVEVWELNVYGCWTLVVFWCWLAAITYLVRFWQGKWRRMRVIETSRPEFAEPVTTATAESSAV
jgi:hypothetical protein